jgi:dUTPase
MGLLSDGDIGPLLATGSLIKGSSSAALTRGAAVELSVGDIFMPGAAGSAPGSPSNPIHDVCLCQGETAVIRTLEELNLDQDHAAVAFPAAFVSLQGLLMTNPGYVDPGYVGPLHVTVINMGRQPYSIKRGERFMRCLFFELDSTAKSKYPQRPSPITEALLRRLSADFMSLEDRATDLARKEIKDAELRVKVAQIWVPVLIAIATVATGMFASYRTIDTRVTKLESTVPNARQIELRLGQIEAVLPLEERVLKLETKTVRDLDDRLKIVEKRPPK